MQEGVTMCSCVFTLAMCLVSYLIGFFFGRVTRKSSKKKDYASDEMDVFYTNSNERFLVEVKTGEYSFQQDLINKYGKKEVFRMLAYGELVHEEKWLEMKKKNECKTFEDVVKREG